MARPPSERAAFLEDACAGDRELLLEVRSLMEPAGHAEAWIEDVGDRILGGAGRAGPDPAIEVKLDGYTLGAELGHGGMGTVYRAVPTGGDGRAVAVKLLRSDLDPDTANRRFALEQESLARLEHPGIAGFLGGGTASDGRPWYAMELVEGEPVDRWCDARLATVDQRVELVLRACEAVDHAHGLGVIHRDLKPSNVLVTAEGRPVVIDFGIAKILDPIAQGAPSTLTIKTRPFTPSYASPEQIDGEAVSPGSDVYSLGAILYRLLAGASPGAIFSGEAPPPLEVFQGLGSKRAQAARMRGIDEAALAGLLAGRLGRVLRRCCHSEPRRRPRSVAELVGLLEARSRPRGWGVRALLGRLTGRV